ncbi:MAG: DEAD/DEAH box helicase [Thermoplasmatota archaeon]
MRLRELRLDPRIAGAFEADGFDQLWPSQEAGAKGVTEGRNLMLAVPTASGKSLVAYLALIRGALHGAKGIYLVPLRALASEKHEDLKRLGDRLGIKVALAMGDLDRSDPHLSDFDIIVATSEKADALLRHRAHWLEQMGVIVADEVHLLHEPDRGPTLEVLLTRFRQLAPEAQIVALSATVANSRDIAEWLDAIHVTSEWRPVTLREGVAYGKAIFYTDNTREAIQSAVPDPVLALADDVVATGGQALVFVNNRKSTEAVADKLAGVMSARLTDENKAALHAAADRLRGGDEETSVALRLAKAVRGGAAFHHAGLTNDQRRTVETLFKAGHIKGLAATPTLAAGINLPARRVIVRDLLRYEASAGMNVPIPVLDYKQMAGRAGRPKYDKEGQAIVISKSVEERTEAIARYLLADPEEVTSKLGRESALRTHLLASVAAGFARSDDALREFMRHTFYAIQSDVFHLDAIVDDVVRYLVEHKFLVEHEGRLAATPLGKRVSELYVDPESAVRLIEALDAAKVKGNLPALGALHAICACPDMITLAARRSDDWLEAAALERASELVLPLPEGGLDYELFLAHLKTALLLEDWIEERKEEDMVRKFNAYPGDIRTRVDAAQWLLHALHEIDLLRDRVATRELSRLEARVGAGAKEELLPLIQLRGVGRVRARALFRAGYTNRAALAAAETAAIERVASIGAAVARSIKRQLAEDRGEIPEPEPPAEEAVEGEAILRAEAGASSPRTAAALPEVSSASGPAGAAVASSEASTRATKASGNSSEGPPQRSLESPAALRKAARAADAGQLDLSAFGGGESAHQEKSPPESARTSHAQPSSTGSGKRPRRPRRSEADE